MLRGFYIEVKVDGRRGTVKVYKQHYTGTDTKTGVAVTVPLFGLKPELDRVVDLAQSQEWSGPVHVVANKIIGEGKLYVAISRARTLANLKISGIEPGFAGLRAKLRSSWRALAWLQEHGQHLPPTQKAYVEQRKRQYDDAFGFA